ncbi:MAG: Uma2 family endonuclease [Nitrospirae bacterium]|nr:Uma2 family endonuclease [Nitrospirota bacterium]
MATRPQEKKKYTIEDYMKTPDDERYELIEGELLMTPSPNTWHQRILGRLHLKITQYLIEKNMGEVFLSPYDVVLDNDNVFEPDIIFVSKERYGIITAANIKGAPDLVIEILSPSTAYRDLVKKKRLYAQFGVQEYWIVDPEEETVEVYTLQQHQFELNASYQEDGIVTSPRLPDLQISLRDIFA